MSDENETVEPTYDVQYTSVRQLRVFVGFDNGSSRWPLRHELIPACRALLKKMTPEERSCVRIDESAEISKLRKRIDELSDTVAIREKHIEMLLEACGHTETVMQALQWVRNERSDRKEALAIVRSIRNELSLNAGDDVLEGVREFKRQYGELNRRLVQELYVMRAERDDLRSSLNGAVASEVAHEKAMAQIERERDVAQTVVDAAIRFRKVCRMRCVLTDVEADLCAAVDNLTHKLESGDPE